MLDRAELSKSCSRDHFWAMIGKQFVIIAARIISDRNIPSISRRLYLSFQATNSLDLSVRMTGG